MSESENGRMPPHEAGVGATDALSLRVSVATLARVQFEAPEDGRTMLALERTATLRGTGAHRNVNVVTKPFGGGVRLTDPDALREAIGPFQFDSERSRLEQDFRLQIRPETWTRLEAMCRHQLTAGHAGILDPSPLRELTEELGDTLGIAALPEPYRLRPLRTLIQGTPRKTESVRAPGRPTVRVYYVFELVVEDEEIIGAMVEGSRTISDRDLADAAKRSERGRANGVLVLGLQALREAWLGVPLRGRGDGLRLGEHRLAGNVPAVLDGIELPGFRAHEVSPS